MRLNICIEEASGLNNALVPVSTVLVQQGILMSECCAKHSEIIFYYYRYTHDTFAKRFRELNVGIRKSQRKIPEEDAKQSEVPKEDDTR